MLELVKALTMFSIQISQELNGRKTFYGIRHCSIIIFKSFFFLSKLKVTKYTCQKICFRDFMGFITGF